MNYLTGFRKNSALVVFFNACIFCRQLVRAGLLTVRDLGSWWISVPFAGNFIKAYKKGKRALTLTLKRARFKEILLSVRACSTCD